MSVTDFNVTCPHCHCTYDLGKLEVHVSAVERKYKELIGACSGSSFFFPAYRVKCPECGYAECSTVDEQFTMCNENGGAPSLEIEGKVVFGPKEEY